MVKTRLTEATRGFNDPIANNTLAKSTAPMAARSAYHTCSLKRASGNRPRHQDNNQNNGVPFYEPQIGNQTAREEKSLKAQRHQASMMLGGVALRAGNLNRPAR
jgi:hypothetical protein